MKIDKFWIRCGLYKRKHPKGNWYMWYTPDGTFLSNGIPEMNATNLIKYAVPKFEITEINISIASNCVSIDIEVGEGDFYEAHIDTLTYEEAVAKIPNCLYEVFCEVVKC